MQPLRLLIVEDVDADAMLLLAELGRSYDITHLRVDTPAAFKEALAAESWDILLSDYSLPQFSALKVLELLRESDLDLPCIVISGTVDEESASETLRAGARDFISKNRLARLVPAIARELKEKEERRRKRVAEEALNEARRRMRFALETAGVGTWEIDVHTQQVVWSPEMETLHGLSVDAFDGTVAGFFRLVHPDDRQRVKDYIDGALHDRTAFRVDYRTLHSPPRWIDFIGRPVEDSNGAARGAAGVALDITEQKVLEEQFRHAQRMESIGRLAGGIAHDFNNLLTAILGFSQLLLDEPALDEAPARVKADLEQICLAGQRAAALTTQLLAFSRKQVLQPTVLDINPVITNLEPMLRRLLGPNIGLSTQLQSDLGRTFSDVGQIEQVLMNLTINARDAMPEGGSISIQTANVEVTPTSRASRSGVAPGSYVTLSLKDTGVGMTSEVRERIFEPFFTTKPEGQGTGLGLATVFGIVKQHSGYIDVVSAPGQGTTFTIFFPRVVQEEVADQPDVPAGVTASRGETILLVDDDSAIRRLASEVLRSASYRVLEAASADEATAVGASHHGDIHLLVTDVVMPGVSGRTLAQRIAAQRPGVKILFMSGYTEGAVLHSGIVPDGTRFLQKPFTPAGFRQAVRQALDS